MHTLIKHSFLCIFIVQISARNVLDSYNKRRNTVLEEEYTHSLGGKVKLNEKEVAVNNILRNLKNVEIEQSFHNPKHFNFSKHYMTYRDKIKKSKVYQIIRKMPKGAALHIHSSLMLGADDLLKLTYEDHLYACYDIEHLRLLFSESVPQRPCSVDWILLSELRRSLNVTDIDSRLKKFFTLYSEDDTQFESDINTVWTKFENVYLAIRSLITYRPVREKFLYESLRRFYEDNVMYVELRSGLQHLYELNGTVHEKLYMAELYQRVTDKFIKDHPDFIGIKLIITRHRAVEINKVEEALDQARMLKKEMPEMFAGFDLVGQEDLGRPLKDFLPTLLEAKDEMNFYFHGGETNWFGTSTDENLVDAILLGSKRIGHAYALSKHPILMSMILENDIALEVNVISNAVLCLVRDVRNHPLASYLALGLPVVLSSDDPGVWGAEPLSHDFYVAFVGIASKHADLRMLKQLAYNSINYSALDQKGKQRFVKVFSKRWDTFLDEVQELYT